MKCDQIFKYNLINFFEKVDDEVIFPILLIKFWRSCIILRKKNYSDFCWILFWYLKLCLTSSNKVVHWYNLRSWFCVQQLVSWCSEPNQPQRITSGWTQTSFCLKVVHFTSHDTTSLFLFSFFFSLFIFRGHSRRERASSRVSYFILRAYTGTRVCRS